jgi:hypothetical protein
MEQNEQNNGEKSNPIILFIMLGTMALALIAIVIKGIF